MRVRTLLAISLSCSLTASGAAASDLLAPLGDPVYFEDFAGELAFPLTPEIDARGLGGMVGNRIGDPLPLLPTISNGEMLISVSEAPGASSVLLQSSGGQVPFVPALRERVGLRARFDGFESVRDFEQGQFNTASVTLGDSSRASGVAAYLLDFQDGLLRVAVSGIGSVLPGFDAVFLSPSADASIRLGNPFTVELLFDLTTRTARAALTVGSDVFLTSATSAPLFDALDIDFAIVTNTTTNNGGQPASIATDVQDFAIFVPEAGASGAALAAAGALAALGARSRPRR